MNLSVAFHITKDFFVRPDRLAPQLNGLKPGQAWSFFAFKAGWLPAALFIWIGVQALNAWFDIPIYYPEFYWREIPDYWTLDRWQNFWVCIQFTAIPFLLYALVFGSVVFFMESAIMKGIGIVTYGSLSWAFVFAGGLLAMINLQNQVICFYVLSLSAVVLKVKFMYAGEYVRNKEDAYAKDESDRIVYFIIAPAAAWIVYGLIAWFSDEIVLEFADWIAHGFVGGFLCGFVPLLFTTILLETITKDNRLKERRPLSFGIYMFLIYEAYCFPVYVCIGFWKIAGIAETVICILASFMLWCILYYRIGNWLYVNAALLVSGKIEVISTLTSPLPFAIWNRHLQKLILKAPLNALIVGTYMQETQTLHKNLGKKIVELSKRHLLAYGDEDICLKISAIDQSSSYGP